MKNRLALILLVLLPGLVFSQGVGINGSNNPPDPSAGLDVSFNNKGILIPRMTEIQRNAIVNPAYGLMILNTDTDCIDMWNGVSWVSNCFDCMSAPVITTNSPACVGTTLTLNATAVPGASYSWTGPNGYTSTQQNLSLTNVQLNQAGTYTVIASFNGCTSPAASVTITVNPLPGTPVAGSNSPVLVGGTVNLTASTIGGASYSWTGPNGYTSTSQNPTITNAQANQSGTYSVVAIANGCTSSVATVVVNISSSGFQTFTNSGSFTIPVGVTSIRVLCVGGGGGGASGHQGGGAGGFVQTGTFSVTPGSTHTITVGAGGTGASTVISTNNIVGNSAGGSSSFGSLLTAQGGGTPTNVNGPGGSGGTGGGGSCNGGSPGCQGGTNGSGGSNCCNQPPGNGQGAYSGQFAIFTVNAVTAGAGGAGGNSSHSGGGGGGGVKINNAGPNGQNGVQSFSAAGGQGYGGGGGAGGYEGAFNERWAGGNGAAGVVYVEW